MTRAVHTLAPLARSHQLVITHGNGPQAGVLALESARDPALSQPYPFDVREAQARRLAAGRGWDIRQDGRAWRPRPSPSSWWNWR